MLSPKFIFAFDDSGTPCLASLPGVWSVARNRLKPGTCTFNIHPKLNPKVPYAAAALAEKTLNGATLALRRISVHVKLPLIRVVDSAPN